MQQWDSWRPRSQWSIWMAPKTKIQRRWQRGVSNARPPTPAEVQSAAIDRVRRLEAAIDALGAGSEEALCLEGVLAQAKRGASLAPVGERLDSTTKDVERCEKRLLAAEDAVKVAISSRDQAAAELEQGQRNFGESQVGGRSAGQHGAGPRCDAGFTSHTRGRSNQCAQGTHFRVGTGAGGIPSQEGPVSLCAIDRSELVASGFVFVGTAGFARPFSRSWPANEVHGHGEHDHHGDSLARSSNRFNPLQ